MEKQNDGGSVNSVCSGMSSREFQGTVETKFLDLRNGLSIRDYFAKAAMSAILSRSALIPIDNLVKDSYDIADAMIIMRENE